MSQLSPVLQLDRHFHVVIGVSTAEVGEGPMGQGQRHQRRLERRIFRGHGMCLKLSASSPFLPCLPSLSFSFHSPFIILPFSFYSPSIHHPFPFYLSCFFHLSFELRAFTARPSAERRPLRAEILLGSVRERPADQARKEKENMKEKMRERS